MHHGVSAIRCLFQVQHQTLSNIAYMSGVWTPLTCLVIGRRVRVATQIAPIFLSIQFVCFSFNSVAKTPASFRNVLLDELLCKETSLLAKSLPFIKVLKI